MNEVNNGIEEMKKKIDKVYEPTPIHTKNIALPQLKKLKNEEEVVISHPLINGLTLRIRKEFKVEAVINLPVVFYGEKYIVSDNGDRVFPQHEVLLTAEEMVDYVERLLACESKSLFYYYRTLERKGLRPGDIIEFEDGKAGVIIVPQETTFGRNTVYVPLKKDGTISKVKPRIIYGNTIYQKTNKTYK